MGATQTILETMENDMLQWQTQSTDGKYQIT
jgi:hypothetical protein